MVQLTQQICDGSQSQQWNFQDGTWAISSTMDQSKCVDIGTLQEGFHLMLWDCNELSQQRFGYDSGMETIYLADSSGDASLCWDVPGGSSDDEGLWIWGCNGLANQQWQVGAMNEAV